MERIYQRKSINFPPITTKHTHDAGIVWPILHVHAVMGELVTDHKFQWGKCCCCQQQAYNQDVICTFSQWNGSVSSVLLKLSRVKLKSRLLRGFHTKWKFFCIIAYYICIRVYMIPVGLDCETCQNNTHRSHIKKKPLKCTLLLRGNNVVAKQWVFNNGDFTTLPLHIIPQQIL